MTLDVHTTGDSTLMHDYKALPYGNSMKYNGAESTAVLGIGTLVLRCPSRLNVHIPDVYLLDKAENTPLSKFQLQKKFKANYTETDGNILVRLPFPATPLLVIFCAHLTFHPGFLPHLPHKFPYASLLCCAHCGTRAALTRSFSAFHYSIYPSGCTLGIALYFSKSPETFQSVFSYFFVHVTRTSSKNSSQQQNQLSAHIVAV
jgi:hypothetical protein